MINNIHPVKYTDISELLPHSDTMLLIDGVDNYEKESISTYVNQDGQSMFVDCNGDVPAWFGIEYMAQTISTYAGIIRKSEGKPIRKGFLLGTRKYESYVPAFKKGWKLNILAKRDYVDDGGVCVFTCEIRNQEMKLATSSIKAIQPEDANMIFRR